MQKPSPNTDTPLSQKKGRKERGGISEPADSVKSAYHKPRIVERQETPTSEMKQLSQVEADMIFVCCKQPGGTRSRHTREEKNDKPHQKLPVDLAAFKRALELIADKVYAGKNLPKSEAVAKLCTGPITNCCEELRCPVGAKVDTSRATRRFTSWEDDDNMIRDVDSVMTKIKAPLERVYDDFCVERWAKAADRPRGQSSKGLTLQNFMSFCDEFGIREEVKLVTIQKTYSLLANEPKEASTKKFMTFDPFCKAVVYLAVAGIDGPYDPHEKLLLLSHLMNATTGAARLAYTRDLFPVEDRVLEISGPEFSRGDQQLKWSSVADNE